MITFGGVTYFEMADSIYAANLRRLPFVPDAYLGYADGSWPNYLQIAQEHPTAKIFGLTVYGNPAMGNGTDSEPGNVGISGLVRSTQGELSRGVVLPVVYVPASWATAAVNAHTAAGIVRSRYRLLTAHYGGPTAAGAPIPGMHICGPGTCGYGPGSDGTQWQDAGPYDRSLLAPNFYQIPNHPGPAPTPGPVPPLPMLVSNYPTTGGPMPSILLRLPIGPNGTGWGVLDGGTHSDPQSASLEPAVPISKFQSLTSWANDSETSLVPSPELSMQNRNGFVYVKATGAQPGVTAVGYLVFSE